MAAVADPVLELRQVCADHDGLQVLWGIDLVVRPGEVVALLGPNGAGKTTTLRVATGLHRPSAGTVRLGGQDVVGVAPAALAHAGLCMVPEGRGTFPNLSVRENLQMMTFSGPPLAEVEARTYERFPRLAQRRSNLAGTLSGGEQQMLAMARALVSDPAVLLVDELSMGLAPMVVEELYEVVDQIAGEGIAVVVVEQFATVALGVAHRAVVVVHGSVVADRPADAGLVDALAALYLGAAPPT